MYATYEEYKALFSGELIQPDQWPKLERRSRAYLDELTYGRLEEPVGETAKLAVCAVADCFQQEETAISSISESVKSFSNDGYSETAYSPDSIRRRYRAERARAVGVYLPLSHPLRYAGV